MDLYRTLQNHLIKYNKIQENIEKNEVFNRILDVYGLYIAPRLKKTEIEQEMIRAAKRGKTKCKLLKVHSKIPMTPDEFELLVGYVSQTIQSMFSDNRFCVKSNSNLVLYILFD